jgi:hypothetical protein
MGQGDNPMEKIVSSVIILFVLGLTEVQAQTTTSDCGTHLPVCKQYSFANDCKCKDSCEAALTACFNEGDKESLESASAHSLNCKKSCKVQPSSSSNPPQP